MSKPFKVLRCLRLPPNAQGRDLVVGDLHGHRSLLERELERLDFDPALDRVLSVGDLIDRGPESLATLSLIEEPWFHAVLGNHELMMLSYLGFFSSRLHSRKGYVSGSGAWIADAVSRNPKAIARLADKVAALPLSLQVGGAQPFHVTHCSGQRIDAKQDASTSEARICAHKADASTSTRSKFGKSFRSDLLGLRFDEHPVQVSTSPMGELPITYVGHSPIRRITVHDSYVYIDQGVCDSSVKRGSATPPTVLDHARFSLWLHDVASTLDEPVSISQQRPRSRETHRYSALRV